MAVTVITPEQFDEFVATNGRSVSCTKTRERLSELLGFLPGYREFTTQKNRIYVPIYIVDNNKEDFAEAIRQAEKLGANRKEPLEQTADTQQRGSGSLRLSKEEQEKATNFALQTLLGTDILASQGIPTYKLEAVLIKQLCAMAKSYRAGKISEQIHGDEYKISKKAMDRLYGNTGAPFIYIKPYKTWVEYPSSEADNRVKNYANSFNESFREVTPQTAHTQTQKLMDRIKGFEFTHQGEEISPHISLCKKRANELLNEDPNGPCFI